MSSLIISAMMSLEASSLFANQPKNVCCVECERLREPLEDPSLAAGVMGCGFFQSIFVLTDDKCPK
jgi:hypothetical protein